MTALYSTRCLQSMCCSVVIKEPLSLEACAERYELDTKKQDTLKEYFAKGYSTSDIPYNELTEYLSADLQCYAAVV